MLGSVSSAVRARLRVFRSGCSLWERPKLSLPRSARACRAAWLGKAKWPHLPLVAGVVIAALGMKKTLQQVADTDHYGPAEPLHSMPAWALAGGAGLFLLGAAAILLRTTRHRAPVLIVGGVACVAAGPPIALVPALVALTALAATITALLFLHGRTSHGRTAHRVAAD
ncbi:low temperature requirement protein A [Streptomyces europaeiscabiei]|uniref:low temperature requirement protein A n=1 Tax=Streptomyces europaeiscabiei TaxID=146819 RepID=UPI0038D4CD0A